MSKTTVKTFGALQSIVVGETPTDTGVIFLHGYGANMHDLYPLWELWHRPDFTWYFPQGILELPMGYYGGRAWFSIDIQKLELSLRNGTHREMASVVPPEFDSTLAELETFVSELGKRHRKIILGGFSQGAMCASHIALRGNAKVDALVLLSGSLIAQSKVPSRSTPVPFYQSHGVHDPILHVSGAQDLFDLLKERHYPGEFHTFQGGHEIPESVITGVDRFLKSLK